MDPLALARTHCRTPIRALAPTPHPHRYHAATPHGNIALFLETAPHPSAQQWLPVRNRLLREGRLAGPLIYEQVERESEGGWVSLTLCEMVSQMEEGRVSQLQAQDLVECGYRINQTQFDYQPDCYMLKHILQSSMTHRLYFDFTRIFHRPPPPTDSPPSTEKQPVNGHMQQQSNLVTFRNALAKILQPEAKISELMFMKERPFVYQSQTVRRADSWLDLALMFNLLHNEKVSITSESKSKIYPISKLNGCINLEYEGQKCSNVSFYEGYRTDGAVELTYQDLKDRFFEEGIIYQMWRQKYICVKKKAVSKGYWTRESLEYTDVILVRPEVGKVEFINFLIGYLRYVEPVLKCLRFHAADNSLQFDFINKRKISKSILIKFAPKYLIKDEELSMILEKSKITNATLELQKMPLSDGFLIFLANCEKLQQVVALDLSHCPYLTQSGLSMLLASPFAKNIASFRLNGLPIPNLPLVKLKKLRQLHVNQAQREEQDGQLQLGDVKLQKLEALDVLVSFRLPETLKYLALNMETPLDSLKILRGLGLVELKVKLIENKKNIGSFFSGIYSRQNPAKIFQEGNSRKTLRRLDLSGSSVALKELKPIFHMDSLQCLLLEDIKRDKFMDLTLPISIMSLSLKNSLVSAEQVCELINKTGVFIRLNLIGTAIDDTTLEVVLRDRKYISLLQIDELQLDLKFMERKGCFECITLQVARLIKGQGEPILDTFLLSQGVHTKEIQLSCLPKYEVKLANKVMRLHNFEQAVLKANITINGLTALHLISLQENSNPVEHFSMINSKSQTHLVRIDALSMLHNRQQLGIQEFNVALHHSISLHPDCLLEVSIRSNRLLGKQVIELLSQHVGGKLRALDFRNCLFSYSEIQQELFAFPCLESVNEGQYEVNLNEEDSCEEELQKILKFFMKLRQKEKMKLTLKAQNISERQLFFSIMYEILHHYSESIVNLHLVFCDIEADPHSLIFWKKVFALPKLENLTLSYHNQYEEEDQEMELAAEFEQLATLKLHSLMIDTSIPLLLPQQLTGNDLKRLSLNLSDMAVTESSIYKLLKNTPNLSHLSLEMKHCSSLTSVSKISDAINRMNGLIKLSLDFENSSIRQASVLELVNRLVRNTQLERFELNLNNCSINITDLVRVCEGLVRAIKLLRIFLYVLQAHPPTFAREAADLLVKGIELQFAP